MRRQNLGTALYRFHGCVWFNWFDTKHRGQFIFSLSNSYALQNRNDLSFVVDSSIIVFEFVPNILTLRIVFKFLYFQVKTFKLSATLYHILLRTFLICLTTCTNFPRLLLTDVIQYREKSTRSESRTLHNEYLA